MKRLLLLLGLAFAMLAGTTSGASAALPGQPNGIPVEAWSNQWRPATGNLCFEDWTNNYAGLTAAAIQHAAAQISNSSDWNAVYGGGAGCEANGYTNANKVTFVMNTTDPDPGGVHKDEALVWTEGGYRVGGYVSTRMIVHLFTQDVDWYTHLGATQRYATMNAVRVLSFKDPTGPVPCAPENETGRPDYYCHHDTILAPTVQRTNLTARDYTRLDLIAPW
jgi:hypothetical protein